MGKIEKFYIPKGTKQEVLNPEWVKTNYPNVLKTFKNEEKERQELTFNEMEEIIGNLNFLFGIMQPKGKEYLLKKVKEMLKSHNVQNWVIQRLSVLMELENREYAIGQMKEVKKKLRED